MSLSSQAKEKEIVRWAVRGYFSEDQEKRRH